MSISVVAWGFVGLLPLSVSVVGIGIVDRFFGDDEGDNVRRSGGAEETGESIGTAFEDALSDEAGRGGPADDDVDPLMADEGEWDGFEDDNLGELNEMSGIDSANLESRMDDLENEVESIKSTVSTVRSENQEISDHVRDVQDNVRQLLDIYEMVTRGVNPFVEDVDATAGSADTFGLFGTVTETESEPTENGDTDDDDFFADAFDADEATASEPNPEADEEITSGDPQVESGAASDTDEGMTFEELKAEYDAASGAWTGTSSDSNDDDEETGTPDSAVKPDEPEPDEPPVETDATDDEDTATPDTAVNPDEAKPDALSGDRSGSDQNADPTDPTTRNRESTRADEKPFLKSLPAGYGAELLVMEWLEYLVQHSSVSDTLQAIRYYRNIEWISDAVAEDLRTVLGGINGRQDPTRTDGAGPPNLSIEHHEASLTYIHELTGGDFRYRSFEMEGGRRGI